MRVSSWSNQRRYIIWRNGRNAPVAIKSLLVWYKRNGLAWQGRDFGERVERRSPFSDLGFSVACHFQWHVSPFFSPLSSDCELRLISWLKSLSALLNILIRMMERVRRWRQNEIQNRDWDIHDIGLRKRERERVRISGARQLTSKEVRTWPPFSILVLPIPSLFWSLLSRLLHCGSKSVDKGSHTEITVRYFICNMGIRLFNFPTFNL